MGREWYWGGRSSRRRFGEKESASPSGCMSAVLQFFDLHHSQFPFPQQQQVSFKPTTSPTTILKGAEAPRNSLESEDASSLSSMTKEDEENLNIPMSIQIKTRRGDLCSEISSSPGTKSPNLVARLMGLDLLPDHSHSPSSSATPSLSGKPRLQHFRLRQTRNCTDSDVTAGTRSLPETPRISSGRRSDVEHRLSLQINKENIEKTEFSHDGRSPNQYARQILKQVKESVSRKVGLDITNTVGNRGERRDDQLVGQFKFKKASKSPLEVVDETSPEKRTTNSCSPRLRFLDSKHKPNTPLCGKDQISQPPKQPASSSLAGNQVKLKPQQLQEHPEQEQKCKKVGGGERFGSRLKKPTQTSDVVRNKQEETFVRPSTTAKANRTPDKKCRKTPSSSVPTLLPVKKDPSPPPTKIPQKQVSDASKGSSQLSSSLSQRYEQQEATQKLAFRNNEQNNGATDGSGEEFQYVTRILRCTGIDKNTPVLSFSRCFSPSHPLHPSIFHRLEHSDSAISNISGQLNLRCNRKLIFHLVDEILIEILKPYINGKAKPWICTVRRRFFGFMKGSELIDAVCEKIRSFPSSDCRVLEDIDALIERDLHRFELRSSAMAALEEEGEGVVGEIEKDVLETLIHETMLVFAV